jgi:hypothetical protein
MLPTTGFFGGCGIGLSLLLDAIVEVSPACLNRHCEQSEAIHRATNRRMDCFVASLLAMTAFA